MKYQVIAFVFAFLCLSFSAEVEILDSSSKPKRIEYEIILEDKISIINNQNFNSSDPVITRIKRDSKDHLSVAWIANGQDGDYLGIFSAVVNETNDIVQTNFQVNTVWKKTQNMPFVSHFNNYKSMVYTWLTRSNPEEYLKKYDISAQMYDSETLERIGGEFKVHNSSSVAVQSLSTVGTFSDGGYIIAWESDDRDSITAIAARFFDANGNPEGDDIYITKNFYPIYSESPGVCVFSDDTFIVTYARSDEDELESFITYRKFDRRGNPVGDEVIYRKDSIFYSVGGCAILEENRFVVTTNRFPSQCLLYFYQRDDLTGDELIKTVGTPVMTVSPSLASSVSGHILIYMGRYNLFLINSKGELIADVVDFTGNFDSVNFASAVFIDDYTAFITWGISDGSRIVTRKVHFKPIGQ